MHTKLNALAVAFLILCTMPAAFPFKPVCAQVANPEIHIAPDGSVNPSSVPIQRNGDTYIFTGDVFSQGILVEKPGVTIDGAGHSLMGPYTGNQTLWIIGEGPNQTPTNETFSIGIDVLNRSVTDVTIKNLNIKNFSIGMYMWTDGCVVSNNAVTDGIVGILLQGESITLTGNYIVDNKNGLYFGETQWGNISANVDLYDNYFVRNLRQLSGCVCVDFNTSEEVHTWDNGSRGNYWSDYNGTDANGDGIGDTPYEIDVLNIDRFPLMQNPEIPPTATPTPVQDYTSLWHVVGFAAVFVVALVVVAVVLRSRRRQIAKP